MSDDVRRASRLAHEVLVAYRTLDGFITDWAVNISKGGLFVNTRSPLEVGAEVKLLVQLPDGLIPFDLLGRVSWINPPAKTSSSTSTSPAAGSDHEGPQVAAPGMGIEFIDIDEVKRSRLETFVEKLRGSLG